MYLRICSLLLVVGLFQGSSSSAVTPEECEPLVTPFSTFTPSFGDRWIYIMGFIDSVPFKVLKSSVLSMWIEFTPSGSDPRDFSESIGIRHNDYCKFATSPVTLVTNTAVTTKSNFTCTYYSLPTCDDCLLYLVDSRNTNTLLPIMKITDPKKLQEVMRYRAIYLMAKTRSVDQSTLDHFKKQAACLGFTGEPDFVYNPKNPFCEKSTTTPALTPEVCEPLITPFSTFTPSFGDRWIYIMGFIDSEPFKVLKSSVLSMWIEFTPSGSDPRDFSESIGIRHTDYCKFATSPVTRVTNTAVTTKSNFTCTYYSLPTCDDCLLYLVDSRNTNTLLPIMKITDPKKLQEVMRYRAVYLMAKTRSVDQSTLDHFKKQAACLGFTGEPDFVYNPKNSFCEKGTE